GRHRCANSGCPAVHGFLGITNRDDSASGRRTDLGVLRARPELGKSVGLSLRARIWPFATGVDIVTRVPSVSLMGLEWLLRVAGAGGLLGPGGDGGHSGE